MSSGPNLIAVPYRHYKGIMSPYSIKLPESAPPTGVLKPCSPSYVISKEVLDWLADKRWFAYQEPQVKGQVARVFINFFDSSDAMMFKLTWGGK